MTIVRLHVKLLVPPQGFITVHYIRNISKMLMKKYGLKPVCGLGVCYKKSDERQFYVDVDFTPGQLSILDIMFKYDTCYQFTVIDTTQNLMCDTMHSLFETYYFDENLNTIRCSPFYGNGEGMTTLYPRDEYSESVSYDTLLQ